MTARVLRTAFTVTADLGGQTLVSGVYSGPTLGLTGAVMLDAQGDPNAVFIFRAGSTLITATNSVVALTNGAQACNVYWQVGSSATLGTDSVFVGTVLALTSVTANTGASVAGRLFARNAAVTLDSNTITRPSCATSPTTTTTAPTTTTSTTAVGSTTTSTPTGTGGGTTGGDTTGGGTGGGGTTGGGTTGGGTTGGGTGGGGTTEDGSSDGGGTAGSGTTGGGGTTGRRTTGGGTTSSADGVDPQLPVTGMDVSTGAIAGLLTLVCGARIVLLHAGRPRQ